jgi:ribosomal protein S13
MKAKITFSIEKYSEIIDLEECGFDESTTWYDLTEDEQNEIRDSVTEQMIIQSTGEHYPY